MSRLEYRLTVFMRQETIAHIELRDGINTITSNDVPVGIVPETFHLLGYAILADIRRYLLGEVTP